MNDTTLDLCIWESRLNGLSEACQTVHAEQKYILNSTGFEFIQHVQPEFTALIFAYPYAENVFLTVKVDAQNYICRLWIYTKKVDKYDKIEDKQRRNKNDRKEKQ